MKKDGKGLYFIMVILYYTVLNDLYEWKGEMKANRDIMGELKFVRVLVLTYLVIQRYLYKLL